MTSDPTEPGRRQPDLLGREEEDADIPPSPHGLAADPLDEESQARLQRMSRRGRTLPALLVLVAVGAFVAIVWWAYRTANQADAPAELPVVEAEPGEEKVRPESEGGLDVPNQDKLIYEQLGQGEQTAEVERLLPPPEEPIEPPAPPQETAEPAPDTTVLTPPPPPQEVPEAVDSGEVSPEGTAAPAADGAAAPEAEPEPDVAEAAPPVVPAPEPEAAPEAAPETTAAEPAPAPEAAPAAPAPEEPVQQVAAAGAFRIQLAAVKSEADAQKEWTRLQKAHADLLGALTPTIQRADLGAQGIFYRIQGGPLANREAAAALCEQLKAKSQACLVVKP
jgi:cell division septation protein DedD